MVAPQLTASLSAELPWLEIIAIEEGKEQIKKVFFLYVKHVILGLSGKLEKREKNLKRKKICRIRL